MVNSRPYSNKSEFEGYLTILSSMAMSLLIFLPFIKMDTPSETSISWGPIISNALARIVLVLGFGSAITNMRQDKVEISIVYLFTHLIQPVLMINEYTCLAAILPSIAAEVTATCCRRIFCKAFAVL